MNAESVSSMLDESDSHEQSPVADPRELLMASPMSHQQIIAVAVTIALCALDGFDVLAITFAAPALLIDWGIGKVELRYVLSAGLLGMAGGSMLIAPAADVLGRRSLIFLSLVLMISGTSWSAVTNGLAELILSRVLTGLGIGAMIAVINPLAAEYANARRRDLTVSLLNIGYPIGGIAGGFLAAYLLTAFGWRAIFVCAAVGGIAMLFVVWRWLPEPIAYIVARPNADALAKVNDYLNRCGIAVVAQLPPPPPGADALPVKNLFRDGMAWVTLKIMSIYFLYVTAFFYMQTWVPVLVAGAGISPANAAIVSVCLSIGGVFGGLFIAFGTTRLGLKPIVVAAMTVGGIFIILFGWLPPSFPLFAATAAATGFFLFGGMIGLYAVVARTFPAHMRASGTGFVIGIGRLGSALSPLLAGLLFSAGLDRAGVGEVMAVPALIAVSVLLTFRVRPPTTA